MTLETNTANQSRSNHRRSSCIVDGPLAFRMRRYRAACDGELGLQILTLPLLAARLAGGFVRPAGAQDLEPVIRAALDFGDFVELDSIRSLPGMSRAVMHTLNKLWLADFSLDAAASRGPRFRDLAQIEHRIQNGLGASALTPRDLRDAAMSRVKYAPAVLGPIVLDRLTHVDPVWRLLIGALSAQVELSWRNAAVYRPGDWYNGKLDPIPAGEKCAPVMVSCANPRAEVVESLRWVRELIVSGEAKPNEIAICATTTESWDDHFLSLATDAALPMHFSHGMPALASREGQACASLADILLSGLSQERVRRLLRYGAGRSPGLKDLPRSWADGIERGAGLFELSYWKRALDGALATKTTDDPRPILLPTLELLSRGLSAAGQAGDQLLDDDARSLWTEALRKAPPSAIEFSLANLRIPDGTDPGTCVVWCPADHLTGAPRPFTRFLGMSSRSWPRRAAEDPLLPTHVLAPQELGLQSATERDRELLNLLCSDATRDCVMSRSRSDSQGRSLAPSPLLPKGASTISFRRTRIPSHAFSETDRVLARPSEMARLPAIAAATECWRNWHVSTLTPHDGLVRANHPALLAALSSAQSATSLRTLLRDPIRFMWRYVLGWQAPAEEDQPLEIDALSFGTLVHELLKRTVDSLEPHPGFGRAGDHEIENALRNAAVHLSKAWPLQRPVPPSMLWQHVLDEAVSLSAKALKLDANLQAGSRSWTEVEFGQETSGANAPEGLPWPPNSQVTIPGTDISVRGKIDRLDRNADDWIRVSDYKTGVEPKNADRVVFGGGRELQRVVYALAAKQLIPDSRGILARLVYLRGDAPNAHKLPSIDQAITDIAAHVTVAAGSLARGNALPGDDAAEQWNDYRLAFPAFIDVYLQRKKRAVVDAIGNLERVWRCQ